MKRKGIRFRRAKHLGYRMAKEGDTYTNGEQIDDNYCVIVRIEECETYEKEGRLYYEPKDAPSVDLTGHSRTNMVYGTRRTYRNKRYDTRSVYWVEDGIVYRGSIPVEMTPEDQPETAWYDVQGRRYEAKIRAVPLEDARLLVSESNRIIDKEDVVLISRPDRSGEESTYTVYELKSNN